MNLKEIKELLLIGEGQNTEFKSSFDLDSVGKVVCAFLNSKGGYIICGVNEKDAVITGVKLKTDIMKLEKELTENLSPQSLISFETNNIEDKQVIVIEVPSGKDIPYSFKNDIFIRAGNKNRKADIDTIRDMVLRRQIEPERWERRFSDADLDYDLDSKYVYLILRKIQDSGRYQILRDELGTFKPLEGLGLVKYARLTNAGDVLFTKNPAVRKPQTRVKAVWFNSDKTDDSYKDIKHFEGPLFKILEDSFNFIIKNIPIRANFTKGVLARKDISLYPPDAIREGLVNAFVHRDYADFSGSMGIYIYPNRLEIWNSGELPDGVTTDNLSKGHISVLRNPDIAHVVYLRGMMEKLGRGSLLIQKLCKDNGLPSPEWKSEKNKGVTLTLFAPHVTPQATPHVTPHDNLQVKNLLEVLKGEMSRDELQERLGLNDRKSFRELYLNPALELGLIEMTIPDKPKSPNQKYRII